MVTSSELHEAAWPVAGDGRDAVAQFLRSLPEPPRLLALGEPTHGVEEFPQLRNQLFQYLVEHEGHRSIALESDCLAGLIVDDYLAAGAGDLDDVLRDGFSHGFGESPANRELVEWMRAYNHNRPADERLRFYGFDAPVELAGPAGPRPAFTALHDYLAAHLDAAALVAWDTIDRLLGDDARWTNPEATMDPSQSVGSSADAEKLRVIADDLLTLLEANTPALISATSRDGWWRARLHGRAAAGLLGYHAGMADLSERRLHRLMGLRDAQLAGNLRAIAEYEARRGPVLVFAHNRHLQKARSRWELPPGWGPHEGKVLEWWSAGAIVAAWLGGGAYAFVAGALGASPDQGVAMPPADTLEGVLATLPEERYLVSCRRLAAALGGQRLAPRAEDNTGYFPLDPEQLSSTDGVLFLTSRPDRRA